MLFYCRSTCCRRSASAAARLYRCAPTLSRFRFVSCRAVESSRCRTRVPRGMSSHRYQQRRSAHVVVLRHAFMRVRLIRQRQYARPWHHAKWYEAKAVGEINRHTAQERRPAGCATPPTRQQANVDENIGSAFVTPCSLAFSSRPSAIQRHHAKVLRHC